MFKSDILFNGYYGYKNTGDDAFVEVTAWAARSIWKRHNIRYLAQSNKLPKTIYPNKGYPLSIPRLYGIQKDLLVQKSNIFISAGGSTFNKSLLKNTPKYIALQRKINKPDDFRIGAIGVSIGPFISADAERSTINYLKHLDFLTLRDKRSYDYVNTLDLPYEPIESFDMAALLPLIYKKNFEHKQKSTIGISLCNVERYINGDIKNEERRNYKISQLLKELDKRSDIKFKFFIINGHPINGDKNLTIETIEGANLKNEYEIIDYNNSTQEVWQEISNCTFMLSTRLHGAIFACFAKVPFILIEYHKKCSDFLDDVGYDIEHRVYDMDTDIQETAQRIFRIIEDSSAFPTPLFVGQMKEKALLNFTGVKI